MHRWWLLSVLLLAVPVQGMEFDVADDPTGDVSAWTQASPPVNAPRFEAIDLENLLVTELADTIRLQLEVASLESPSEAPIVDDVRYIMSLAHEDQSYLVIVFRAIAEQDYYWGQLIKSDIANQRFTFVRPIPPSAIEVDPAAGTIALEVLRSDLTDQAGAHPIPGRSLSDFWAFAGKRRGCKGSVRKVPLNS